MSKPKKPRKKQLNHDKRLQMFTRSIVFDSTSARPDGNELNCYFLRPVAGSELIRGVMLEQAATLQKKWLVYINYFISRQGEETHRVLEFESDYCKLFDLNDFIIENGRALQLEFALDGSFVMASGWAATDSQNRHDKTKILYRLQKELESLATK